MSEQLTLSASDALDAFGLLDDAPDACAGGGLEAVTEVAEALVPGGVALANTVAPLEVMDAFGVAPTVADIPVYDDPADHPEPEPEPVRRRAAHYPGSGAERHFRMQYQEDHSLNSLYAKDRSPWATQYETSDTYNSPLPKDYRQDELPAINRSPDKYSSDSYHDSLRVSSLLPNLVLTSESLSFTDKEKTTTSVIFSPIEYAESHHAYKENRK